MRGKGLVVAALAALPVALGGAAAGYALHQSGPAADRSSHRDQAGSRPSLAASEQPTVTVTATASPQPTAPTAQVRAQATRPKPQGIVVLDEWHDVAGTLTCADVETWYDNRSDTAVLSVRQTFQTSYTPKHRAGVYPPLVDGPVKTLTQVVGIQPFSRKRIAWRVCAPEVASLAQPVSADGTDSFESELGAAPTTLHWNWIAQT